MFSPDRVRSHRIAGLVPVRDLARHYAASTATIVAVLATAVVAAASTGISLYTASQQADAQAKAAKQQAQAEEAAGAARRKQVEYDAERKRKTMYSHQAASGALIGQGSLLEGEMAFASEAEYGAQLAAYPHMLAGAGYDYQSKLFGAQSKSIAARAPLMMGISGASSLASGWSGMSGLRLGSGSGASSASNNYGGASYVP